MDSATEQCVEAKYDDGAVILSMLTCSLVSAPRTTISRELDDGIPRVFGSTMIRVLRGAARDERLLVRETDPAPPVAHPRAFGPAKPCCSSSFRDTLPSLSPTPPCALSASPAADFGQVTWARPISHRERRSRGTGSSRVRLRCWLGCVLEHPATLGEGYVLQIVVHDAEGRKQKEHNEARMLNLSMSYSQVDISRPC